MADVLGWLLEEEQPSIRYLALTQLLDKPESDSEVTASRVMIATSGMGCGDSEKAGLCWVVGS